MKIEQLFARDIHRPINGVVKADQLDDASVWQELDEFVVTRELRGHMNDLVGVLLRTMQAKVPSADHNGIWVSGFFGSGKSHFIKVLSYLLNNREHQRGGESRRAVSFFADKLEDAALFADLKLVTANATDTILFNIDTKADHKTGRDALLQVFLKVLNEKQGYSGDHPHIAHMERHLDEKGKLAAFQSAFEREAKAPWIVERDAWQFHRDEVTLALKEALGQSDASVVAWVDGGEAHFSLTVENFARWVKRYLDQQGPQHRLMFLVDEVGQFIGNDSHLMLNLQTITEQLGTLCGGRAWVVVTSQEDLDAVLGDMKSHKQQDFSKIQGRFKTRLSLSSANVDEVIKKRLLEKKPEASLPLLAAYEGKHDILRNQLSFLGAKRSFKSYADGSDFAACYPFPAYQFSLVQKVFESIRKAGATGLHLSQGERSTLDAFQGAAKKLGGKEIGRLVPFYEFYPAVEGFLDTGVKRTIEQARDTHTLQSFDSILLQVLFLIRYINDLPGSVDNLVTLCVDEIDTDKLTLRKKIEASLARLESETLIARNGDIYFFLSNEERDIGREIKNEHIPSGAEERELGKLLFDDVLKEARKHTYSLTRRDFAYARSCDGQVVGTRIEGGLEVAFTSPLGEGYGELGVDAACILNTSTERGRLLIRLPDDPSLGRELRVYLQTDTYVRLKNSGTLPETTKRILQDRSNENRDRRERLVTLLGEMMRQAHYFASGKRLELTKGTPKDALSEALEYLIANAYPKMGYLHHLQPNPQVELQSLLRVNDVEKVLVAGPEANTEALDDLREYIRLCTATNKQIVLYELINQRYGQRPYGWPELELVLLVARLAVLKEIDLVLSGAPLALDQAYDHLVTSAKQRKVVLVQRQVADRTLISQAQSLGKELFGQQGPSVEDTLYATLRERLKGWSDSLSQHRPLAETGEYPGKEQILEGLQTLRPLVEEAQSLRFLERFVANRKELLELGEEYQDIHEFYTNQKQSWEALRRAVRELGQNRLQLDAQAAAGPALQRMEVILQAAAPYGLLHEVAALIQTATVVNTALIEEARNTVAVGIESLLSGVVEELDKVSASPTLRREATAALQGLLDTVGTSTSIAHIHQARAAAEPAFDKAMTAIERAQGLPPPRPPPPTTTGGIKAPPPVAPPVTPPPPVVKKRRVVSPKELCSSTFLETQAEVDTFLRLLRVELEAAIAANERIQIK